MAETTAAEHETEQPSNDPTELLTAGDLARRLRVSLRQVWKLHSEALLPGSIRLGRSKRWRVSEITQWVARGCPDRATWETMQNGQRGSDN